MFKRLFDYKWLVIILILVSLVIGNNVMAAGNTYEAPVSTHSVTDVSTLINEISGNLRIMKVVFTNVTATAATASLYEGATSTTTVSHVQMLSVPANNNVVIDYPSYGEPTLNDFTARASATGMRVFLLYR